LAIRNILQEVEKSLGELKLAATQFAVEFREQVFTAYAAWETMRKVRRKNAS
jgi:hypothetical protein